VPQAAAHRPAEAESCWWAAGLAAQEEAVVLTRVPAEARAVVVLTLVPADAGALTRCSVEVAMNCRPEAVEDSTSQTFGSAGFASADDLAM
jgi:hypothetical protein